MKVTGITDMEYRVYELMHMVLGSNFFLPTETVKSGEG